VSFDRDEMAVPAQIDKAAHERREEQLGEHFRAMQDSRGISTPFPGVSGTPIS
jgi:hypothetical protein